LNTRSQFSMVSGLAFCCSCLLLLAGCAQKSGVAPSYALKEQLQEIRQQQQAQQQQLEKMQEQLARFQQQLTTAPAPGQPQIATGAPAQPVPQEQRTTSESPAPTVPLPQGSVADLTEVADSAASYLTAFSNLASGQYHLAESGFANFLATYPDHQYAPNARFWLANAQSAQGKTDLAVANLRQIIADPLGQEKAPAALVQLIGIYRQAGLTFQADEATEQLRSTYGNTAEAQQFLQNEPASN